MTMTTIKSTTEKKVRDDTTHKCDLLFLTKLTIGGDNYRYNKKHIELELLKLGIIQDKLPKYSKYREDISFVFTHKVKNYSIKGFLNNRKTHSGGNSKFVKVGVFRDLKSDIDECVFGEVNNFSRYAHSKKRPEQWSEITSTLGTLNFLSNTFNSRPSVQESYHYILSQTDQIQQYLFPIDNEDESGGAKYMDKVMGYRGYGSNDYDGDIVCVYGQMEGSKNLIDRFTQYITPEKFEEHFKLKEHLDNLEKEYSKDKDVSVKLELNKTFDIKLTRTLDDTDESLMCRAKDILYSNLINTLKTSDDIIAISNKESECE